MSTINLDMTLVTKSHDPSSTVSILFSRFHVFTRHSRKQFAVPFYGFEGLVFFEIVCFFAVPSATFDRVGVTLGYYGSAEKLDK